MTDKKLKITLVGPVIVNTKYIAYLLLQVFEIFNPCPELIDGFYLSIFNLQSSIFNLQSSIPLVFATNNLNKLREVKALLPENFQLMTLNDIDCTDELPETGSTIKSNALQKALYVSEKFGVDCFADDSGLEVDALGGEPGVYSARYAGPKATAQQNNDRLIKEMNGEKNRAAQFRTVIALIVNGGQLFFEGIIRGRIAESPQGENGFGYDPLFIPDNYDKTFAEMSPEEKNRISHRGIAIRKLAEKLASLE